MYFMFDPTWLLYALPGLLIALWAQAKVSSTFARYSKVAARSGCSGAQAAHRIMQGAGLEIDIEPVPGKLTDHYDPRKRRLHLSEPVYGGRSLAALGVAAHEAGHAIQHKTGYAPMALRQGIYPVVGLGSRAAMPLFFLGLILGGTRGLPFGQTLMTAGIFLFIGVLVFQIVTLPVEFNASRRALRLLVSEGIVAQDEVPAAKKVLSAAALTYVAAVLQSLLILLYMLSRRR
jgi:hypothetical protein